MIFLTSDTHFGHNKQFLYGKRGFESIEEHDQAIIKNWNEMIKPEDEVFHLGDVMLGDSIYGAHRLHNLNGNIHLILGNHDTIERIKIYEYMPNIVEMCYGRPLNYNGYHFFLSHYPTITSNFDYDKPLKARLINICGHSHTTDPFSDWSKGVIYHVDLDAHFNRPVTLDGIILSIQQRFANTVMGSNS